MCIFLSLSLSAFRLIDQRERQTEARDDGKRRQFRTDAPEVLRRGFSARSGAHSVEGGIMMSDTSSASHVPGTDL